MSGCFGGRALRGAAAMGCAIAVLAVPVAARQQSQSQNQNRAAATATQAEQKPPEPPKAPPPKPVTIKSPDGTKIVFESVGAGPTLILLHGGGQTRRSWNDRGYVDKLKERFTVVTVDLRGSGDSEKPTSAEAYAIDRLLEDILAVADATKAPTFHIWGFGHGATIGRYLAARSNRVASAVLVGAPMGPTVTGVVKDAIEGMRAKWQPLVDAQKAGTLDLKSLSPGDRAAWENGVATTAVALGALAAYPPVEPSEIKAPTLWLVGSADASATENAKGYEGKLAGTPVTFAVLDGLSYSDSFAKSEPVLAKALPFLTASR